MKKETKQVKKPKSKQLISTNELMTLFNKTTEFVIKNQKTILIVAGFILFELLNFGVFKLLQPNTIAKLDNGSELVAEIDGLQITANDLYNKLKDASGGYNAVLDVINSFIANKEVETTAAIIENAQNQIDAYKVQYQQNGEDFTQALINAGYKDEATFKNLLILENKKQEVVNNYLINHITDDEIQTYYDKNIFGNITTKHILIKPVVTETMTDAEKAAAEATALKAAQDIIVKLNNGEDFATLAKAESDDTATAVNGGEYVAAKKTTVTEYWDAAAALKDGAYTKTPVKTTYGYHIILRVSQATRPTLEATKDDAIDSIITDMKNADQYLNDKTWAKVRTSYNLKIYETHINDIYNSNMNSIK
jgi:foldase protein PrsA